MNSRVVGPVVAAAVALAACGHSTSGATTASAGALPAANLSLVAYSTPQQAYEQVEKAFQATAEGKNITFTESYGASGDQSRAVESGLQADIVSFSLEPDMTRLVTDKIVAPDWNAGPTKGMLTDSVVVFVVRKGNPKNIHTWADLTRSGLEVITPNPFTSGGARWNVIAAYGALSAKGGNDAAGVTYLNALFKHVPVQDDSARKALTTFTGGKGDVMLGYESEAIFAQQHGQAVDYVIPDQTILIENPVAVTARSAHPDQAKAFLDFLLSDAGQRILAANGYRPVHSAAADPARYPTPSGLFTIADLGGWTSVTKRFFDPNTGVLVAVERSLGVATKK